MEIRDARPEEFDEIANLTLEAHREYDEVLAPEEWEKMQTGIAKVKGWHGECEVIVAEADGSLAGSVAYFAPGTSRVKHFPQDWASIRLLAVHPAHRGQRIGRLLTQECIRRARRDGTERIGLHTGKSMRAARKLYESMGFEAYRELPPMFGVPYTVYSMGLAD